VYETAAFRAVGAFPPQHYNINYVDVSMYRPGRKLPWHRDGGWIVGLTMGGTVQFGFGLTEATRTSVELHSGDAILFNGAIHSHAVLDILNDVPSWWQEEGGGRYGYGRMLAQFRDLHGYSSSLTHI